MRSVFQFILELRIHKSGLDRRVAYQKLWWQAAGKQQARSRQEAGKKQVRSSSSKQQQQAAASSKQQQAAASSSKQQASATSSKQAASKQQPACAPLKE